MLFELSQNTALLELHIEALKCAVNGFIALNVYVNQTFFYLGRIYYSLFMIGLQGQRHRKTELQAAFWLVLLLLAGCSGTQTDGSNAVKDPGSASAMSAENEDAPVDPQEDIKSAAYQIKTSVDALAAIREKSNKLSLRLATDAKQMYTELLEALDEVAKGLLDTTEALEKLTPADTKKLQALVEDLSDTQNDLANLRDLTDIVKEGGDAKSSAEIDAGLDDADEGIDSALDLLADVLGTSSDTNDAGN